MRGRCGPGRERSWAVQSPLGVTDQILWQPFASGPRPWGGDCPPPDMARVALRDVRTQFTCSVSTPRPVP
jgi:hypothetical protein